LSLDKKEIATKNFA